MKVTREREIKIIEYSTERQLSFEYAIIENGFKVFGWNNGKMPVEYITKALFKPIPPEALTNNITERSSE